MEINITQIVILILSVIYQVCQSTLLYLGKRKTRWSDCKAHRLWYLILSRPLMSLTFKDSSQLLCYNNLILGHFLNAMLSCYPLLSQTSIFLLSLWLGNSVGLVMLSLIKISQDQEPGRLTSLLLSELIRKMLTKF